MEKNLVNFGNDFTYEKTDTGFIVYKKVLFFKKKVVFQHDCNPDLLKIKLYDWADLKNQILVVKTADCYYAFASNGTDLINGRWFYVPLRRIKIFVEERCIAYKGISTLTLSDPENWWVLSRRSNCSFRIVNKTGYSDAELEETISSQVIKKLRDDNNCNYPYSAMDI